MNKGFTLFEIAIVLFIIALLSAILFLAKTSGEEKLALQRAAYQLSQDLREVQEMAMGAGEVSCGTHIFGVYLKQGTAEDSYTLFGDCNGNCHFDSPSSDEVIREVSLEKNIFYNLSSSLHVVFAPPDPKTYINSNNCQVDWGQDVQITLQSNSGESKTVKINSAGKIEIE